LLDNVVDQVIAVSLVFEACGAMPFRRWFKKADANRQPRNVAKSVAVE
jgi:hypothetical protein